MSEQEWNPLEGWTKEQIRSTLKAHSKTDLLKIAMQWRILAHRLQQVDINDEDSKPTEEDVYDDTETGTSVED